MSDISMPTEPPKEQPRKELLDNLAVKFVLSLIAWAAPAPVAVVLLKLFSTYTAAGKGADDPFASISHSITHFSGSLPDILLLAALLPSLALLLMIYRKAPARIAAILVLLVVGIGEFIALAQMSA